MGDVQKLRSRNMYQRRIVVHLNGSRAAIRLCPSTLAMEPARTADKLANDKLRGMQMQRKDRAHLLMRLTEGERGAAVRSDRG